MLSSPFPFYFLLLVSYFFLLLQCIGGLHPVICLRISFATIPFSSLLLSFFSTCFTFTAITFYDQDTIKPAKSPHPWFQICFHFQAAANLFNKHNTIRTGAYAISTVIISNVHRLCISSNSHSRQHFSPNNPHLSSSPLHQYLSPISLSLSLFLPQFPFAVSPSPFSYIKKKPAFKVIIFLSVII